MTDISADIADSIASPDFPVRNDRAIMAILDARKTHAASVREGLLRRIAARLELPYGVDDLLQDGLVVDEGSIADLALDTTAPQRFGAGAYRVVGPKTVGRLIDRLLALDEELHRDPNATRGRERQQDWVQHGRLRDAVVLARQDVFLQALLERAGTNQLQCIVILSDLLAAHGRQEHGQRLIVDHNTKPALMAAINGWITAMLASPSATRHQFSNVVRAIERFPDASFANGLRQMLERDLSDREKARAAYLSAPRRGPLSPDLSHSYTLDYQTAFAAIGGAEVIAILKEYLTDLRFGACAAAALYMIWTQENVPAKERQFMVRYDYSRARELRRQRQEAPEKMPTSDFAEAIFAAVRSLGKSDADEASRMQALALATTGLGLPHGDKRSEIDALLALPRPSAVKQRLLIGAAMVGEIVPADALINGFRELLETGKSQSWRLAEDRGELMGWIELFPFSDRPEAVFAVLDDLPEGYRYPRSMERLLSAIAKSPHPAILDVLIKLGEWDEKLQADHRWLDALMELKTEDSALVLLNLIYEGRLTGRRLFESHRITNRLATAAEEFPAVRTKMVENYERMGRSQGKVLLEGALIELTDPKIILLLIGGYAKDGRPYDDGMAHAIRQVALGRRSIEGWAAGAYEEFSVSLAGLRKDLFGIATTEGDARAVLAKQCLDEIETLRDEYGRIDDEPRHPDIASGKEWPLLTRSVVQSPT
jgi:hypothetical protein